MKEILHNLSGEVEPGEAVAILGGSGAGKTVLLDVLSGRIKTGKATGDVLVNRKKRDLSWKQQAAYVEQEDLMYPYLTVRETVRFAAMLKLPEHLTKAQKEVNVEAILTSLGLRSIVDSYIGEIGHRGISGGQRRRVSIGKNS